jgi:hypothetical protein
MTTMAKSNAIFRTSIIFHIIDVMDGLSRFATDGAGVIISLANHALEWFVKCIGIWFIGMATIPRWIILSCLMNTEVNSITLARTKIFLTSVRARDLTNVFLSAIGAYQFCALLTSFIKTFLGTIFSNNITRVNKKIDSTMWTNFVFSSALPEMGFITTIRKPGRAGAGAENWFNSTKTKIGRKFFSTMSANINFSPTPPIRSNYPDFRGIGTRIRAKSSRVFSVVIYLKMFTASLANFINSHSAFNGATPLDVCECLGRSANRVA